MKEMSFKFFVKRVGEMARGDVEDNGANWRNSEGRRSTEQELYDRKIYWWFEDEKGLKDDSEWQEKKSELNENGSDWQVSGDNMLGDLSWKFGMWEKEFCTEFFHLYWANEEI